MSRTFFVALFVIAIVASYLTIYEAVLKRPESVESTNLQVPTQKTSSVSAVSTVSSDRPTMPPPSNEAANAASGDREPASMPAGSPQTNTPAENPDLVDLRERLELQAQKIAALRRVQAERVQQTQVVAPYLITQKSYDIEDLQSQVQQTRDNLTTLSQTAQENLEIQRQQNQMAKDELDYAIQQLGESITNIQRQFEYYNATPPELSTGIEKQQYLMDLRTSLAAQVENYNILRAQRAQLPQTLSAQNQVWQNQLQQSRANLLDQQNTLQSQIFDLRRELRDLQISNRQTNMSLVPLEQQIQTAEKDYQILQNQMSALENAATR